MMKSHPYIKDQDIVHAHVRKGKYYKQYPFDTHYKQVPHGANPIGKVENTIIHEELEQDNQHVTCPSTTRTTHYHAKFSRSTRIIK